MNICLKFDFKSVWDIFPEEPQTEEEPEKPKK
jgi:hypothetical protein